jgi:hypothetical protein
MNTGSKPDLCGWQRDNIIYPAHSVRPCPSRLDGRGLVGITDGVHKLSRAENSYQVVQDGSGTPGAPRHRDPPSASSPFTPSSTDLQRYLTYRASLRLSQAPAVEQWQIATVTAR